MAHHRYSLRAMLASILTLCAIIRESFIDPGARYVIERFMPRLRPPIELVRQRAIRFGQVEMVSLGVGGGHPARC